MNSIWGLSRPIIHQDMTDACKHSHLAPIETPCGPGIQELRSRERPADTTARKYPKRSNCRVFHFSYIKFTLSVKHRIRSHIPGRNRERDEGVLPPSKGDSIPVRYVGRESARESNVSRPSVTTFSRLPANEGSGAVHNLEREERPL